MRRRRSGDGTAAVGATERAERGAVGPGSGSQTDRDAWPSAVAKDPDRLGRDEGDDGEQRRVQPTLSREGGEAEQVPDGRDAEGDRFEDAGDEQRQPQEGVLAGLDEARSAIGASVEDGEELPCGDRDERQRLGIGTFQAEAGGDAVVGTETDGGDEAAWVAMRRKVLRPMTGSSAGRGGSFMVS